MTRANETKHQEIEALLPAYVLGALDQEESLLVESYIQQQRDFLAKLEKLDHKASQLAYVTQPVAPPPNIRRSVLMIARLDAPAEAEREISTYTISSAIQPFGYHGNNGHNGGPNGSNGHSANNGHAAEPAVTYAIMPYRPQQTERTAPKVAQVVRQRRLTLRLWQIAAVTALIALLIMAAVGLLLNRQLDRALEQVDLKDGKFDALLATNSQLLVEKEELQKSEQSLLSQNQTISSQQQQLSQQVTQAQHQVQVMTTADSSYQLNTRNGTEAARAGVYVTGNVAALFATGLPLLPSDKTFQLWFVDNSGRSVPVAVFTTQLDETNVWREFSLSRSAGNLQLVAISIEPIGGSVTPSDYILQSEVK
ncbi:MAG: anti-sigma factor [Caldilineaceae bacterium]